MKTASGALLVMLVLSSCSPVSFVEAPEILPGTELDMTPYEGHWRMLRTESALAWVTIDGTPYSELVPGQPLGPSGTLSDTYISITATGPGAAALWTGPDFDKAATMLTGTVVAGHNIVAVEQEPDFPVGLWVVNMDPQGRLVLGDLNTGRLVSDIDEAVIDGVKHPTEGSTLTLSSVSVLEDAAGLRSYLESAPNDLFSSTMQARFEKLEQQPEATATPVASAGSRDDNPPAAWSAVTAALALGILAVTTALLFVRRRRQPLRH